MDFRESFFDVVFDVNSPVNEFLMGASKQHMEAQLPGEKYEELRERLQPHYAVGCKRVIITDDYFPTFTRENVTLETSPITEITEKGVAVEGRSMSLMFWCTRRGLRRRSLCIRLRFLGSVGGVLRISGRKAQVRIWG
jgi:cation diffusion facilitator CzcD-associated flavoprotein CzcO